MSNISYVTNFGGSCSIKIPSDTTVDVSDEAGIDFFVIEVSSDDDGKPICSTRKSKHVV